MSILHEAARIAREHAMGGFSPDFAAVTNMMCWDAVEYIAAKTGAYRPKKPQANNFAAFITAPPTNLVAADDAMRKVPQGSFIGFFGADGDLKHAMIATGHGCAAGNKNGCVGVGKDLGWEILDLGAAGLWNGGVFGPRKYQVVYRDTWPNS